MLECKASASNFSSTRVEGARLTAQNIRRRKVTDVQDLIHLPALLSLEVQRNLSALTI